VPREVGDCQHTGVYSEKLEETNGRERRLRDRRERGQTNGDGHRNRGQPSQLSPAIGWASCRRDFWAMPRFSCDAPCTRQDTLAALRLLISLHISLHTACTCHDMYTLTCLHMVALFSPARVPDVVIWQPRRREPMCDPASPFGSHGPTCGEAEGANTCTHTANTCTHTYTCTCTQADTPLLRT
jgi:hypothetical protein